MLEASPTIKTLNFLEPDCLRLRQTNNQQFTKLHRLYTIYTMIYELPIPRAVSLIVSPTRTWACRLDHLTDSLATRQLCGAQPCHHQKKYRLKKDDNMTISRPDRCMGIRSDKVANPKALLMMLSWKKILVYVLR